MTPDPLEAWPAFADAVRARLEVGRSTYGDRSFAMPAPATLGELEAEALDLAGWGFILWARMRSVRGALETLEADAGKVTP